MSTEPDLETVFERLSESAMALLPMAGPFGSAAQVASIAFASASKMARDGIDPAVEFERMHGADPMLRALARVAKEKFPRSDPPSAPDTVPFSKPPSAMDLFVDDDEESRP